MYRRHEEDQPAYRPLPQAILVPWLGGMGQPLFAPPNVKGWPGGRAWLNTATMLERDNFAAALASAKLWPHGGNRTAPPARPGRTPAESAPSPAFDSARLFQNETGVGPEE